jgi:3'(2'), 5'-bisphosphate nucleotidase
MMEQVGDLAKRAGKEIMKIYNTDFIVETKTDNSPVTDADRIAENIIVSGIHEGITASYPIIGEEAYTSGKAPEITSGPFWLVDAIDGTKSFISKNDQFTVNIALIDARRPVLGVIHAPALGDTFWGGPSGAFAEYSGKPAKIISCRKPVDEGLVVVASLNHRSPELEKYIGNLKVTSSKSVGSSLKFCLVADGSADVYPRLGRTMEWDIAAGHAIVNAAGGSVKKIDGSIMTYAKIGLENPDFIVRGLES